MMKIFILFFFNLYSICSFSQDSNKIRVRISSIMDVYLDKYGAFGVPGSWKDTSMLAIWDPQERNFTFYGESTDRYDFIDNVDIYDGPTLEYKFFRWSNCVTPKGGRCGLRFLNFVSKEHVLDKNFCVLYLDYHDLVRVFKGKLVLN